MAKTRSQTKAKKSNTTRVNTARYAATLALTESANRFPDLNPASPDATGLSSADAALAQAIYVTAIKRWGTLAYLLGRCTKKPLKQLEPRMQAVLLGAGAQLLFMDKVPDYAVIDESVKLARQHVRKDAGPMTNAVLRKLLASVERVEIESDESENFSGEWQLDRQRVYLDARQVLVLNEPWLPKVDNHAAHLEAVFSTPQPLVLRWLKAFGLAETVRLCQQSLQQSPLMTWPNQEPWTGSMDELRDWLKADRSHRVQDPTSASHIESLPKNFQPATILDFCAGKGTKTRQLAERFPNAKVFALEIDEDRAYDLADVAELYANVEVLSVQQALKQTYDLVVLDVPCSNTGVLARRPEAKYRVNDRHVRELVDIQASILQQTLPCLNPTGHLLYITCSIESSENEEQVDAWVDRKDAEGSLQLVESKKTLPNLAENVNEGSVLHHDGGYHAMLRRVQ